MVSIYDINRTIIIIIINFSFVAFYSLTDVSDGKLHSQFNSQTWTWIHNMTEPFINEISIYFKESW